MQYMYCHLHATENRGCSSTLVGRRVSRRDPANCLQPHCSRKFRRSVRRRRWRATAKARRASRPSRKTLRSPSANPFAASPRRLTTAHGASAKRAPFARRPLRLPTSMRLLGSAWSPAQKAQACHIKIQAAARRCSNARRRATRRQPRVAHFRIVVH
jgi:hypothetical protein